ncbi:MAG: FtsW/RodA/SpoVE family cell cycle protein [Actinomycetota bacterium]|nr:FtsW/RodA/SpoVE family cell cycle protein [Actinomycetota bacterium]
MHLAQRRNQEIGALLLTFLLVLAGFASLLLSCGAAPREAFTFAGALAFIFIAIHLSARKLVPFADPILIPIMALLTFTGVTMIYRLKPGLAGFQSLWVLLSAFVLINLLILLKDYKMLKNYKYSCALLGLMLLLSPIFFGYERYGARLWLKFGPLSFQPSEIAKILLAVFFAAYLEEKRELLSTGARRFLRMNVPGFRHFGPLLIMWIISLSILVFEKDLGSSLLFLGLFLGMLYAATGRKAYVVVGILLFMLGATSCYYLFGHVQTRIDIWLNPWKDIEGKGYQIVQSLFAIASGGVFGSGLGLGYPTRIPAVHTDFIFSALCEELGLAGGFGIILAYLLFIPRGFKIALTCEDEFGKLMAAGLTLVLALQTLVIIGGVTRLIPLTGVTLPFVSYGGSSILSNFILVGLLLSISNESSRGKRYE